MVRHTRHHKTSILNPVCFALRTTTNVDYGLAAALDTGSIFYDVGANVGFYSLLGAACVGSGGRVIAFEPVPENLLILQKHIAMNQLTNVTVIPAAVSDRCGAGRFQAGAANTTGCLSVDGDREVETVAL